MPPTSRATVSSDKRALGTAIGVALPRRGAVSTSAFDRVVAAVDVLVEYQAATAPELGVMTAEAEELFARLPLSTKVVLTRDAQLRVTVPADWGCCAFAGDRGMLHPELTASATSREVTEVAEQHFDAYVSCNRTCEIGMTRATGHDCQHVLELVDQAARSAQ